MTMAVLWSASTWADELSKAQSGEVIITSVQLLSDLVLVYPGAFQATSFKLA